MKIVHKDQVKTFKNSEFCTALEYPMDDKDINGAIIKLDGRYPDSGNVVNTICKEMAYITEGEGLISVEGKITKVSKGDLLLIEPGEKYYWEGKLTMFVPSTPAWYPEQHKEIKK